VKAPRFAYARPTSVAETLAVLAEHKGDARILAGGQSLMPMLNFRVAAPKVLVDINRIAGLSGITVTKDRVRIGALTRHAEIERSADVARHLPLLALAMPHVAHPAIRNRGTFGGSCALADPAAELPACALALGATFVVAGRKGERRVSAHDFFKGLYATALAPDELLVAAEFPLPKSESKPAFGELARRHGDYAMVGIAAQGSTAGRRFSDLQIVLFGACDRALHCAHVERELEGRPATAAAIDKALDAIDAHIEMRGDLHASAATKRHLARVLAGRVLKQMEGVEATA
jgi:carbon-monoxide dehydrogenase medium subunit